MQSRRISFVVTDLPFLLHDAAMSITTLLETQHFLEERDRQARIELGDAMQEVQLLRESHAKEKENWKKDLDLKDSEIGEVRRLWSLDVQQKDALAVELAKQAVEGLNLLAENEALKSSLEQSKRDALALELKAQCERLTMERDDLRDQVERLRNDCDGAGNVIEQGLRRRKDEAENALHQTRIIAVQRESQVEACNARIEWLERENEQMQVERSTIAQERDYWQGKHCESAQKNNELEVALEKAHEKILTLESPQEG